MPELRKIVPAYVTPPPYVSRKTMNSHPLFVPFVAISLGLAHSAKAAEYPTFTDPKKAGADFQVQGEYVGKVGGKLPIGIQVMAQGKRKFIGVIYTGGLPGAGWDESTAFHVRGKTQQGKTIFEGVHGERLLFSNPNFSGWIEKGVFRGTARMYGTRVPNTKFHLKRVLRKSPTLGAKPPKGALVLFDGSNVKEWQGGKLVADKLLDVGTTSKRKFGSVRIHMEFICPFMSTARGMHRGNSGVYVKSEWEIQIVDSFGWHHENRKFERLSKFARCGGIHEMIAPRINMSYPPLSWQTYDIVFIAAKLDSTGKRLAPATMTVRQNGVLIHNQYVLPPVPPGRKLSTSKDGQPGPIFLQRHGNPVRFRNIWVVEGKK